ncbi:MAG: preprotein translocase subunit SecE [Acidobacteriota bacterium]|nr:preprotein translocase subunit SecE [Acidobacteriota bacterium]
MSWVAKTLTFLAEVKAEWKKVTVPSWKEVRGTTVVVMVASFLLSIYLWFADIIILRLYELVLGIFG